MRYDLCISFEGNHRAYARRLAVTLRKENIYTFFDEFEQARLWGAFLLDELGKIYFQDSYFCIILLSREYYQKMYPNRERRSALLHQAEVNPEYILPIRMDDSEIDISLRGIVFLDRKKITIAQVVSRVKVKLQLNREKVNDDLLHKMVNQHYEDAADYAKSFLRRVGYVSKGCVDSKYAPVIGIFLYNLSCSLSRMAEAAGLDKNRIDLLLDEALTYAEEWISNPILRPSIPDSKIAIEMFNRDDDLLTLRKRRTKELTRIYRIFSQSIKVKILPSGKSTSGGGCVLGNANIRTNEGDKPAFSIALGTTVMSYSIHDGLTTFGTVRKIITSRPGVVFIINNRIIVSGDQHFFVEKNGWMLTRHLRVGMRMLRADNTYDQVISIAVDKSDQLVYGFSISSEEHTFIANGYVCHNELKIP